MQAGDRAKGSSKRQMMVQNNATEVTLGILMSMSQLSRPVGLRDLQGRLAWARQEEDRAGRAQAATKEVRSDAGCGAAPWRGEGRNEVGLGRQEPGRTGLSVWDEDHGPELMVSGGGVS